MQVLQAGTQKFLFLELEEETMLDVATQAGFECRFQDGPRAVTLDLLATGRTTALLLFDAADPYNLGWFSRCQFYVDGNTGSILQTPFVIANKLDPSGYVIHNGIRIQISKELPEQFKLPAKQPVNEKMVYTVLFNFLTALIEHGVAICGGRAVKPLAGRGEGTPVR
jgi:hypothetical protein